MSTQRRSISTPPIQAGRGYMYIQNMGPCRNQPPACGFRVVSRSRECGVLLLLLCNLLLYGCSTATTITPVFRVPYKNRHAQGCEHLSRVSLAAWPRGTGTRDRLYFGDSAGRWYVPFLTGPPSQEIKKGKFTYFRENSKTIRVQGFRSPNPNHRTPSMIPVLYPICLA